LKNRVCRRRKTILKVGEEDGRELRKIIPRQMRIVRTWRTKSRRKGRRKEEREC
jgi:hypothetical protein